MGGWGSGRHGGRPTVEAALTVDLALMFRRGWIKEGSWRTGTLTWSSHGNQVASIGYEISLTDVEDAWLNLKYRNKRSGDWESREQFIRLSSTVPNFGGRRWWMHCPVNGKRVGKLHLPSGGDIFASQKAWKLGYHIQRVASRDRVFERLFRLQNKLGCVPGWEAGIHRPKGMHHATFERQFEQYLRLDEECGQAMASYMAAFLKTSVR